MASWTEEEYNFVKENHLTLSYEEMSEALGTRTYKGVKDYCYRNGFRMPASLIAESRVKINKETREKYNNFSGEDNPNWKGGISKNNYHYKLIQKERYPEKIRARERVHTKLESGKLVREPCLLCSTKDEKAHAHHEDYSKPLLVLWLCRKCHTRLHNSGLSSIEFKIVDDEKIRIGLITNFVFQKGYTSKETKAISIYAMTHKESVRIHYYTKISPSLLPDYYIPVGTIEWVTSALGHTPKPDHYPQFMSYYFNRIIWETDTYPSYPNIFVKPSDIPKRFEFRISKEGEGDIIENYPAPPYWCSTYVEFINEWRYYIVNGEVVYIGWYSGEDEEATPPPLPFSFQDYDIPNKDWCGVIDLGMAVIPNHNEDEDEEEITKIELTLVECGEPYSIGWYGTFEESEIYVNFIVEGWKHLLKEGERVNGIEEK